MKSSTTHEPTRQAQSVRASLEQEGRRHVSVEPAQEQENAAASHHSFGRVPILPGGGALIQPKLRINAPGDRYEQEADRIAEQVMRLSGPPPAPLLAGANPPPDIQRECAACEAEDKEEEEGLLMRKADSGGGYEASPALISQLQATKGGGEPLPEGTRSFMESAIGADFSGVRVHTDAQAVEMSRGIQARAFTHGQDIYFNRGEYAPESAEGRRLLGHELVHVGQGRRSGQGRSYGDIQKAPIEEGAISESIPKSSDISASNKASNVGAELSIMLPLIGKKGITYSHLVTVFQMAIHTLKVNIVEIEDNPEIINDVNAWIEEATIFLKLASAIVDKEDFVSSGILEQLKPKLYQYLDLAKKIQTYKINKDLMMLKERAQNAEKKLRKASKISPAQQEAMRSAFLQEDNNTLAQIAGFVDLSLSIGNDLNDLAKYIMDSLEFKNPDSGYTEILKKFGNILTVANYTYSLANVGAPTELRETLNKINLASESASLALTFLNASSKLLGPYVSNYVVPATSIIVKKLSEILDKKNHDMNVAIKITGGKPDMSTEPGKEDVYDYMLQLMKVERESEISVESIPEEVRKFFISYRKQFGAGAQSSEPMPVEGIFLKDLDTEKMPRWLFVNRQRIWYMLYGRLPV